MGREDGSKTFDITQAHIMASVVVAGQLNIIVQENRLEPLQVERFGIGEHTVKIKNDRLQSVCLAFCSSGNIAPTLASDP